MFSSEEIHDYLQQKTELPAAPKFVPPGISDMAFEVVQEPLTIIITEIGTWWESPEELESCALHI